jgi:probable rRNA maturation factor
MKFILEVNNKTKQKLSKKRILEFFDKTIELVNLKELADKELELSVALVNEDEIATLNLQYRKKNSATDVLSFSEYPTIKEVCGEKLSHVFLGELILCPAVIEKNAKEDGETLDYAFSYIISHGILHLLGLDHGKKMFDLQKSVADQLVIK